MRQLNRSRSFPRPHAAGLASLCAALLLAACGGGGDDKAPAPPTPPGATTYTVGVTASGVAAGESFGFSLGSGTPVTVTQSGVSVKFAQALAAGAPYTVTQASGPRSCTLSANRTGAVAAANIEVTADCAAVAAGTALVGAVRGPLGTQVVLQATGAADTSVTVTLSAGNTDRYDEKAFSIPTTLASGAAYQLSVKTAPAGQTCTVYKGAAGTLPVAADAVRVGCEYTRDLASRSSDDSVLGSYYGSGEAVIGGANVPIGNATDWYGEGRFIVFTSSATGLAGAGVGNGYRHIYWRDQLAGVTVLVSRTPAGAPGNNSSYAAAVSADGLTVVFESVATDLVSGDTNGVSDVFLWSATDGVVKRISVGAGGAQANGGSFEPTVSGDGSVVAFSSGASNLTGGVSGNSTINVIRRDLATGTNTLITANAAGNGVGGARPALSEDGKRLAFYAYSSEIVAGDSNGLWDVFVHDATTQTKKRVSLTSTGGERNQGTESASRVVAPAISGDGRYVAFATTASNMVPGDSNGKQDVFVVDTQTGAVVRASVSSAGAQANDDSPILQGERLSLSYDGTWVAFTTKASNLGAGTGASNIGNVVMHNRVTGETRAVTDDTTGGVERAMMSRTGAYVLLGSSNSLDPRFASSGLFSRFTGVGPAWWWGD
jgi:Tol biopolymer transport system component